MALLWYFKKKDSDTSTSKGFNTIILLATVKSLSEQELESVNDVIMTVSNSRLAEGKQVKYIQYSAKEKRDIGKYASENGATKACRYYSKTFGKASQRQVQEDLKWSI